MQNRRGLLFLGLAILLGLFAAMSTERWLAGQTPEPLPEADMASVVVARVDLPVASELDGRKLELVPWPAQHLPPDSLRDLAQAEGRVLRRPLVAGEPVLTSALLEQGARGGLTGLLDMSKRAMSVKVDAVVGVAGFVRPGASVDVIATLRRLDRKALPFSKIILQDVRVLAVDQKLEEARNGEPELVNVVTLEVEPQQAEQLTYAAHEGRLQLALRNPADEQKVDTRAVSVVDLLGSRRAPKRRSNGARTSVQLIQGSKVSHKSF